MPLSKPGKDLIVTAVISARFTLIFSIFLVLGFYQHASSLLSFLASTGFFFFCLLFDHFPTMCNPLFQLCSSSFHNPISTAPSILSLGCDIMHCKDHTRKIELVRYLMSSYVNGKVLDTLSEHANALASSAVASLEDEAEQLSHFPFLSLPSDPVLTVPKHHGWYS